jgi:hypothetical protein
VDDLAQLTPAWLTEVLRAHGHLPIGRVTQVSIRQAAETFPSKHARLAVVYSTDAPRTAPASLFLKWPKPETVPAARREARFYATIAPHTAAIPFIPCYGTGAEAETPYLLLADVSDTHRAWGDGPLYRPHLEAMVALLARVHAWWWEHPGLGDLLGEDPAAALKELFAPARARYAELLDRLGDQLAADDRRTLERYLDRAPALFRERVRGGRALTLCHPDNHPANFLFPRQPGGPIYLVDWHVCHYWWGPSDIAALVTRAIPPSQQHLAEYLMRGYHARLIEHGVTGYSWEDCWRDYRLGVIDTLRVILSFRRAPSRALQSLALILPEFRRRDCAELLG